MQTILTNIILQIKTVYLHTDVRLENLEVRVSHLEYRLNCIEATSNNAAYTCNTASAWPTHYAMGYQMPPPPFPAMLQSYDQMASLPPPTHMPSSVGIGSNIGVPGVPSPVGKSSTMGVSGVSPSATPPSSLVPSGPFLAVGNPSTSYLSSSAIPTHQLRNIDEVIAQHRHLLHDDSAGTLCQILAKEAVFGKDLLARCTVTGKGGTLALPVQEMNNLKKKIFSLFPMYHSSPEQFEPVWKKMYHSNRTSLWKASEGKTKEG